MKLGKLKHKFELKYWKQIIAENIEINDNYSEVLEENNNIASEIISLFRNSNSGYNTPFIFDINSYINSEGFIVINISDLYKFSPFSKPAKNYLGKTFGISEILDFEKIKLNLRWSKDGFLDLNSIVPFINKIKFDFILTTTYINEIIVNLIRNDVLQIGKLLTQKLD